MTLIGVIVFLIMGLTLGLIGGGGSILTVPILVYIFKQDPLLATANSLVIVGATAGIGSMPYLFKKLVDIKTVFLFSVPSFIGVYAVRKFVLPMIPDVIKISPDLNITKSFIVMFSFAVIMLIAAIKMIYANPKTQNEMTKPLLSTKVVFKIVVYGFLIGSVAGFVGAGGGFLIIPALTVLLNLPMRIAVGSSLLIIAFQSLLGFAFSSQLHLVHWNFLFTQVTVASIGILVGSYLNRFIAEKKLKASFGYFVLTISLLVMVEQVFFRK